MKYLIAKYENNANNLGTFNLMGKLGNYNQLLITILFNLVFSSMYCENNSTQVTYNVNNLTHMEDIAMLWKCNFHRVNSWHFEITEQLSRLKYYFLKRIRLLLVETRLFQGL